MQGSDVWAVALVGVARLDVITPRPTRAAITARIAHLPVSGFSE
jgi:hypothetical protein